MLFRRREAGEIGAIMERIRAIVARQSGHNLAIAADSLKLPAIDLARLFGGREEADRAFVIDVITALAYEAAVDPQWILTGECDGAVHRHVLMLGEDRSAQGRIAVREFVQHQYRGLPRNPMFPWWPARRSAQHRTQATAKSA
jgi:hypothetical protein